METFDTTILAPGQSIKLLAPASMKSRFTAKLVGYKANKYLILETPMVGGTRVNLEPSSEWTGTLVAEGRIVSFPLRVLGAVRSPHPVVFTDFPQWADSTNLRRHRRIPVFITGQVIPKVGDDCGPECYPIIVSDISEGGCRMGAKVKFEPGDRIELELALKSEESVRLIAEIKSVHDLGGRYLAGTAFVNTDNGRPLQRLSAFLDELKSLPVRL